MGREKKRKLSNVNPDAFTEERTTENPSKKVKLCSAQDFIAALQSKIKDEVLLNYYNACTSTTGVDFIKEFLDNEGKLVDVFNILDKNAQCSTIQVVKIAQSILLQIIEKYTEQHQDAIVACQNFLTNRIVRIHRMLDEGPKEKAAILRLLSAFVMLSPTLGKEVLTKVKIDTKLLDNLTQKSLAMHEICQQFILAFFSAGHYPLILQLISENEIFFSLTKRLKETKAETIVLTMNALRTQIVEQEFFSKPAKLKIFHQKFLRNLLECYFWKGAEENKLEQVRESLNELMLALCTSINHGIIFKDDMIGLSKLKNLRMITIIESWNSHKYQCDQFDSLIIKIAGACPDIMPHIWRPNLEVLEDAENAQWEKSVKFTKMLISEVQNYCKSYRIEKLNVEQYKKLIEIMVLPKQLPSFMKKLYALELTTEKTLALTSLTECLLSSLHHYIEAAETFSEEKRFQIKLHCVALIENSFPSSTLLLNRFYKQSSRDLFEIIVNIFYKYSQMHPSYLDSFKLDLKIFEFLDENFDDEVQKRNIQCRLIQIFIAIGTAKLTPSSDMFRACMSRLIADIDNAAVKEVAHELLKCLRIFSECDFEITIWLNAFIAFPKHRDELLQYFMAKLNWTFDNLLELMSEISELKVRITGKTLKTNEYLLALIGDNNIENSDLLKFTREFSPLLLFCLKEQPATKSIKYFLQYILINSYHNQTDTQCMKLLIDEHDYLSAECRSYILNWPQPLNLKKIPSELITLSEAILKCDETIFFDSFDSTKLPDSILTMTVFYLINNLTDESYITCLNIVKRHIGNNYNVVYNNAALINKFSPISSDDKHAAVCTKFIIDLTKHLLEMNCDLNSVLIAYQNKLSSDIVNISRRKNFENLQYFLDVINIFKLKYFDCLRILHEILYLDHEKFVNEKKRTSLYEIIVLTLNNLNDLVEHDEELNKLDEKTLSKIYELVKLLNTRNVQSSELVEALNKYLNHFPDQYALVELDFLESVINREEVCQVNINLLTNIIPHVKHGKLFSEKNIKMITDRKSVVLPLLDAVYNAKSYNLLKNFYDFEPTIIHALQKPQKAGQHFENHYKGVCYLIKSCMKQEKINAFLEKELRFAVTAKFHVEMLLTVYLKYFSSKEINPKFAMNAIMTFIHLIAHIMKKYDNSKLDILKRTCLAFLQLLKKTKLKNTLPENEICNNAEFRGFCNLIVPFGVGEDNALLKVLLCLMHFKSMKDKCSHLMNALYKHDLFIKVVTNEESENKLDIFNLILRFCELNEEIITTDRLALLFSSYNATISPCDKVILKILKMFEAKADQSNFYNFRPFLWGQQAMNHYMTNRIAPKIIISQIEPSTLLTALDKDMVNYTIKHYQCSNTANECTLNQVYDLTYLLPVFAHILSEESTLKPYYFVRHGGLSLTLVALSSSNKDVRNAAGFVLSRFYYKIQSFKVGRDQQLWIHFIEALRKAKVMHHKQFEINNFAAIFLARTALILSKPQDVMYMPLTRYFTVKGVVNLTTIPEVLTFMNSSHLQYQDYQRFIFDILVDGLRTEIDYRVLAHTATLKHIMVFYTSIICDYSIKKLILKVIINACKVTDSEILLTNEVSILPWIYNILQDQQLFEQSNVDILSSILIIIDLLSNRKSSLVLFNSNMFIGVLEVILDNFLNLSYSNSVMITLIKIILKLVKIEPNFLTENRMVKLIERINSKTINYLYKSKYIMPTLEGEEKDLVYHGKMLIACWINNFKLKI